MLALLRVVFFFHDYVQMEKEERSFVRVEVSPRPARPRLSCTSLLQEPPGSVNDPKLQAPVGEVARSVALRWLFASGVRSNLEQLHSTLRTQLFPVRGAERLRRCAKAAQRRACRRRWGETERTDLNSVTKRQTRFWNSVWKETFAFECLKLNCRRPVYAVYTQHCKHTDNTNGKHRYKHADGDDKDGARKKGPKFLK